MGLESLSTAGWGVYNERTHCAFLLIRPALVIAVTSSTVTSEESSGKMMMVSKTRQHLCEMYINAGAHLCLLLHRLLFLRHYTAFIRCGGIFFWDNWGLLGTVCLVRIVWIWIGVYCYPWDRSNIAELAVHTSCSFPTFNLIPVPVDLVLLFAGSLPLL